MTTSISIKFSDNEPWLDFRDMGSGVSFDLTPEAAVAFFKAKGLNPSFSWMDLIGEEHDKAFTVAKMMDVDMLADVRKITDQALSEGKSINWFVKNLKPMMAEKGWWGKKTVIDPLTGKEVEAQLGSVRRLNTIYRTNMQSAYATGAWGQIQKQAKVMPWLMYDAVDDHRTRPEHAQWDNLVLPATDPFWISHYPPNGWNCRCGAIQMTDAQLKRHGLKPGTAPKIKTHKWINPRTGKTHNVPVDLDPGWDHNPGIDHHKHLEALLSEKLDQLPTDMQAASKKARLALAKARATYQSELAAKAAVSEAVKAAGVSELSRSIAKTKARSIMHQLEQIDADKPPYLHAAKKQIEKTQAGKAMGPEELLAATKAQAVKSEASAALAGYKKAMLGGKSPSAKAQAAFDSLPAEAQADVTSAIQAKLAAEAAEKAAAAKLQNILEKPQGQKLKLKALNELDTTGMTSVEVMAKVEQIAAAAQAKASQASLLSGYKKKILEGKIPTEAQSKAYNALSDVDQNDFIAKVSAATKEKNDFIALYTDTYSKAPNQSEIAGFLKANKKTKADTLKFLNEKSASTESIVPPAAAPKPVTGPIAPDDWSKKPLAQTGAQQGSNKGGFYKDTETGEAFYIKYPSSEDIARNEVLAAKLYEELGIDVPELTLIKTKEGVGIASRIVDGVRKGTADQLAKAPGAHEGFVADAWLANWDVTGMGYDNLLLKGSKAYRIDVGGSLRYRAQGGLKGDAFGASVDELDSLRNSGTNSYSASVFGDISESRILAGAKQVAAISDDQIKRIVNAYGPESAVERAALIKTLIDRRQDIKRRFPDADIKDVAAPIVGAGERITEAEAKAVTAARSNGYAVRTDKGHIEDQQVLLWENERAGKQYTNAYLKVRGDAEEAIIKQTGGASARPGLNLADVHMAFSKAAKGIGAQANNNQPFRAVDIQRLSEARDSIDSAIDAVIIGQRAGKYSATDAASALTDLRSMKTEIEWMRKQATEGLPAIGWRKFIDTTTMKGFIEEVVEAGLEKTGIQWTKKGAMFKRSKFEKGSVEVSDEFQAHGDMYEAYVDGVQVRYFPGDDLFALKGRVEVSAAGKGKATSEKIFDALKKVGVNTDRSTNLDIEELYLTQIAYHQNKGFREFNRLTNGIKDQGQRVEAMRESVSKIAGVPDITKLDDYDPFGSNQAFNTGWRHTYRPDITGPEWSSFEDNHRLHHAITAGGMQDSIRDILNSGGMMAPTTDKLRRGIPIGGMSPTADLRTGGANYFFTRIKQTGTVYRNPGFVWKAKHVKRLDAISYDGDNFGRTTGDHVAENRRSSITEWANAAKNGGNETIFKHALSIFDDLDAIVVNSLTEKKAVIRIFKDAGYSVFPDGRTFDNVIRVAR